MDAEHSDFRWRVKGAVRQALGVAPHVDSGAIVGEVGLGPDASSAYYSGRHRQLAVHHIFDECFGGRQIAEGNRAKGTGGFPLCRECEVRSVAEPLRNLVD